MGGVAGPGHRQPCNCVESESSECTWAPVCRGPETPPPSSESQSTWNLTSSPAADHIPIRQRFRLSNLKREIKERKKKGICLCLGGLCERRRIPFSLELGGALWQIAVEVDLTAKTTFIAPKGFLHTKKNKRTKEKEQKKEKETSILTRSQNAHMDQKKSSTLCVLALLYL